MGSIVLPFIHVNDREDETADLGKKTDIGELVENERRYIFQYNKSTSHDPSASIDLQANMQLYYVLYCFNVLRTIKYSLFGVDDITYVTHALKNMNAITMVSDREYKVLSEQFSIYVEDTGQQTHDFSLALVLDTTFTVHPVYVRCSWVADDGVFTTFRVQDGYNVPWTTMEFAYNLYAHYPIKIIPTNMTFAADNSGEGWFKVRAACVVDVNENKRAIL